MKFYACLLLSFAISMNVFAQVDAKKELLGMNKLLASFSTEQTAPLNLLQQTGTLEQTQDNFISRIKLADLGKLTVTAYQGGFSVNLFCIDSGKCVNLIRPNSTNANMSVASFFFKLDGAANAFAEHLGHLVKLNNPSQTEIPVLLYVDEKGKTNILRAKESPASTKSNQTEEGENVEKSTPKKEVNKPKEDVAKNTKEEDQEIDQDEDPIAAAKAKAAEKNPPTKTNKQKKEEEVDAEQADEPITKTRRQQTPMADAEESEDAKKTKAGKDFCDQINFVIKSGKDMKFKDLEGKVLNADNKTNESKLKIKGAKRSYLSTYQNQRAFIAEFKILTDSELAMIEFDKLQTQIEDCLEGNWDNNDRSGDEEYADIKDEVRDVEYNNENDKLSPTVRIIMLSDGKKYILFVRIR